MTMTLDSPDAGSSANSGDTSSAPDAIDLSALALRLAERTSSGDWAVLLVAPGTESAAATELAEALREIADEPVAQTTASTARELIEHVRDNRLCVIAGASSLIDTEWQRLDRQRSMLLGTGNPVLVIDRDAMDRLARHAPNLQSWIAGSVWTAETTLHEMSDAERAARLDALRSWFDMSDQDVIARAENGELPGDPEYVEWLVLLDRGDLIERDGEP